MPLVRVTRRHGKAIGIGVWNLGDEYHEQPNTAAQKVAAGFVEYVGDEPVMRSKESPELYQRRTFSVPAKEPEPVEVVSVAGNWYTLSDGSKVLGKRATAERAGITVEELEALDVDSLSG